MSDVSDAAAVQSRSFSIRLTPDDQTALAELCDLYGLDRPDSIRRAIRQALAAKRGLVNSGYFVSAGAAEAPVFPIRLNGKNTHD